jgi:hypothetical protein
MADGARRIIALARFLTAEQGGRVSPVPAGSLYRPLLDLGLRGEDGRPRYLACQIALPKGEAIRPGDDRIVSIEVTADPPAPAELPPGATFTLSDGPQVVAEGKIWDTAPLTMADYIAAIRAAVGKPLYLAIVRVTNDRSISVGLSLEPWGMVVPMPPGVAYDIVASGPADEWKPEHALQVDVADDYTVVWAESVTDDLALFYGGDLVYGHLLRTAPSQ